MLTRARLASLLVPLALAGCGATDPGDGAAPGGAAPVDTRSWRVVTADWLDRRLSVLRYDALVAGGSREEALLGAVDLSAYAPGPLELDVTPDGATALVAVGGGFFGGVAGSVIGSPEVPEGSALLSVDLASGEATPIALRHAPMGVVVAPDGARAFVAEYGGSELAVVDLASNAVVAEVPLAGGPEQVALDATGARGIVGTDEDGSFRTFDPADPAGTMSAPLRTSADPNGAAFVAGTTLAVVASSIVPSGWAVLETADGAAPVSKSTGSLTQGPPYAVAAIPGTTSVLVGEAGKPARLVRVDAAAEPAAASEPIVLPNAASAFPLGVAVDPAGRFAFVPLTGDGSLAVVDLAAGTARRVAWPSGAGPSWATVVRSPGAPSSPPPGG